MSPKIPLSNAPPVPDFHESDQKLELFDPAELVPKDYSDRCRAFLAELVGGPLAGLKILDVGCGRGELVWRLREEKARAFGVEVEPRYLANGEILNTHHEDVYPLLALAGTNGQLPYPADFFDLVVSFQVLEHVPDLERLVHEIARVLHPGGTTVHVLPAKYRLMEPHYGLPLVHWLPKTAIRRRAISMMLAIGLAADVLPRHDRRARGESIFAYANGQTFYRSPRTLAKAFAATGLILQGRRGARALIRSRRSNIPFASMLAASMNLFRTTVVTARKPIAPGGN